MLRFVLAATLIAASVAMTPVLAAPDAAAPAGATPAASEPAPAEPVAGSAATEDRPEVGPPPFSEGIFPCTSCHLGMDVNRNRRVLVDFHDDIVLKHDEQHRWCLDCHDAAQRDSLHLASGERIPFDRSYLLCGQCHGEKLRDWRAGVHGRRTGSWNGHKTYLLCPNCHNPHQPHFRPLEPKPAPRRPVHPGKQEGKP